ncbi:hypothetical protein [Aureimonas leprariae]|uniref:Uncharacterized protein n=1 Tax=Plantimonas leprariae TaxID=2615207 RepID=A0A7V7TYG6_9HYPH|nr:hypothetical protein [Aureimonas leprariae]KAB0677232.1 hypothetical protein F6X38_19145 [Aureimonas leprariae]
MNEREPPPFGDAPSLVPPVAPPDPRILPGEKQREAKAEPRSRPRSAREADASFFTSRKYVLLVAGLVVFAGGAYKSVFGPTSAERSTAVRADLAAKHGNDASTATSTAPLSPVAPVVVDAGNGAGGNPFGWLWSAATGTMTNGMAPSELMRRKLVAGPMLSDIGFTLGELVAGFDTYMHPSFEPMDADRFILRISGTDPLSKATYEYAFRFVATDGPEDFPSRHVEFTGPAVIITDLALNGELLGENDAFTILLQLQQQARIMRR